MRTIIIEVTTESDKELLVLAEDLMTGIFSCKNKFKIPAIKEVKDEEAKC